tara:strand:+ start:194 stop:982 length:789 start_codon:yes stop_codon:yes gene_type:complete
MSKKRNPLIFFRDTFLELTKTLLILSSNNRSFSAKGYHFNWGIIWGSISNLVIVAGLATLFSIGLRGRAGVFMEFLLFLFLFWFSFQIMVANIVNLNIPEFLTSKERLKPWLIILSTAIISFLQAVIRFLICLFIMILIGFELEIFRLLSLGFLISIFGFCWAILVSNLLHSNSFLRELHGFFIGGLFFISSILISIPALPDGVLKDILLYNPLVHLHEWVKEPTTGIYYDYIDINYFLTCLFSLILLAPVSLYYKNKKVLE